MSERLYDALLAFLNYLEEQPDPALVRQFLVDPPVEVAELVALTADRDRLAAENARLTGLLTGAKNTILELRQEWEQRGIEAERLRAALERIAEPPYSRSWEKRIARDALAAAAQEGSDG